jgi:four helix bundle protein
MGSKIVVSGQLSDSRHRRRTGRLTVGEFQQFLGYARGSLLEVETLILIASDLNYINSDASSAILTLAAEVGRILNGLLHSISKT